MSKRTQEAMSPNVSYFSSTDSNPNKSLGNSLIIGFGLIILKWLIPFKLKRVGGMKAIVCLLRRLPLSTDHDPI